MEASESDSSDIGIDSTTLLIITVCIIAFLLLVIVGLVSWIVLSRVKRRASRTPLKPPVGVEEPEDSYLPMQGVINEAACPPRNSQHEANQQNTQGHVEITPSQANAADNDGYEQISDDENITSQGDGYDRIGKEDDDHYERVSDDETTNCKESEIRYDSVCEDDFVSSVQNHYEREIGSEQSKDLIGQYEVEPYFNPASEEKEVIAQIEDRLEVTVIPKEEITLHGELGSGEFGKVYRGVWSHTAEGSKCVVEEEVAVKTMRGEATEEEKIKFLQEAAKVAQFKHYYVVCMKGLIIDHSPMIVLELMKGGDLSGYLKTTMRENLKILDPLEAGSTLLSYTKQLSLGMYCFARKSYIHRDFAARNVLMSEDGATCKIADFGLSRDLQDQDHYVASGGKIPVKWTAPEALLYRRYSTASDVWSFGCVLYEIWSLGKKPFQELTNKQTVRHVVSGHRLPPPPGCPRIVYNIMIQCWHPKAEERPTFCTVMQELQRSDFEILRWSAHDIKKYSPEARRLGAPLAQGKVLYKELQRKYIKNKKRC